MKNTGNSVLLRGTFIFWTALSLFSIANGQTTVSQWQGDKKGAVSITFDDGITCQLNAFPILQQHGFKATFFIITGYVDVMPHSQYMNSADILTMVADGQKFGSHTVTHPQLTTLTPEQMDYQLSYSQFFLQNLTGLKVDTIAYPGGAGATDPTVINNTKNYYIAARGSTRAKLNDSSPSGNQWYQLSCISPHYTYGAGDDNAIAGLNYWADQAAQQHKWAIEMFHGIDTGYDAVSSQAFDTHLDYLTANEPDLWVAPMSVVAHYVYERNAASINLLAQDINSIKLDLHCGLDSRFDAPLTLLTDCPPDWSSYAIRAKQDQTPLIANIVSKNGHLYIMYNAIPDAGTIELYPVDMNSSPLPADFNFDGTVDYGDMFMFSQTWLVPAGDPSFRLRCDLNVDFKIDFVDFALFAQFWQMGMAQVTFTISGTTGIDGITMSGLPGDPVTSGGGLYSGVVPDGWSGTVTPVKDGYTFDPASRSYTNVRADQSAQDYTPAQLPTFTISGTTGVDGVTMSGLPGNPVTSGGGLYSAVVPYSWSGTVTPAKEGYNFSPSSVSYTNVTSNLPNRNFTATPVVTFTISGTTGVDGVIMVGLPGDPVTSSGGFYSAVVPYGWSGTITPTKIGYTFSPESISYTFVTSDLSDRNFTATQLLTFTISGTTGVDGVTMSGLPGNPVTDSNGFYSAVVPSGWSGTVTPTKAGYIFSPENMPYTNVGSDQSGQDYTATGN